MRYKAKILFLIIFTIFLGACTIQKRQHLPGLYVHWNSKNISKNKHCAVQKEIGIPIVSKNAVEFQSENKKSIVDILDKTVSNTNVQQKSYMFLNL